MTEIIKILYIDDKVDNYLTQYLQRMYKRDCFGETIVLDYNDMTFDTNKSIEDLLGDNEIKGSNIIIMDSSLFDFSDNEISFSGEDFKAIFKKLFPFTEVIVITQHDIIDENYQTVKKFKVSKSKNTNYDAESEDYYDEYLFPKIDNSIKTIIESRRIIANIKKNNSVGSILVEKLENLLEGISNYDELEKNDINEIVSLFKKIQEYYDEQ